MPDVEKLTVVLPPDALRLIREAIAEGDYESIEDVLLDALRAWKMERAGRKAMIAELRRDIQEGIESGPGDNLDVEDFIKRAKERWQKK